MHQLCNVLRKDYLHGLLQQSDYKHFSPASLLYLYMYKCVCVLLTSPLTYTHTLKKITYSTETYPKKRWDTQHLHLTCIDVILTSQKIVLDEELKFSGDEIFAYVSLRDKISYILSNEELPIRPDVPQRRNI